MHKKFVLYFVSKILMVVSLMLFVPLGWALFSDPHHIEVTAFIVTIFLGIFLSALFQFVLKIPKEQFRYINAKDGLAIVGTSWILLSFLGALPLYFAEVTPTFIDALFEVVSGFTTTGATIFSDIEALPKGILFWRSLTHWLGGMGIIVLYVALLPAIGVQAVQLYRAEAPGLTGERMDPRIKDTSIHLWGIYLLLSLIQTLCFKFAGMSWFDSFCHTFSTMATGGFSTKNASMAAFGAGVQWITIVFMFLAGVNFVLHYQAFRGRPLAYFKNEEFRCYFLNIFVLTCIFSVVLWLSGIISVSPVRDSLFQIVSIFTSTGFVTENYELWPAALQMMLVILMFVGACGGSTGGGLKIIRAMVSVKFALKSIRQSVLPNAVLPIRMNQRPMSEKLVQGVLAFFALYVFLFFIGALLFNLIENSDIITSTTVSISALSNIGPGLGGVGPMENYGWISPWGKALLMFLMLAGRLELYAVLVLFLPTAWRK